MNTLKEEIEKFLIDRYSMVDKLTIEEDARNDAKELLSLFQSKVEGIKKYCKHCYCLRVYVEDSGRVNIQSGSDGRLHKVCCNCGFKEML